MSNLTSICVEYRRSNKELENVCNKLLGDSTDGNFLLFFVIGVCFGAIFTILSSLPKVQEVREGQKVD